MDAVTKLESEPVKNITSLSIKALRKKAIAFHRFGELDKAVALYKACIKVNARDVGIWNNLGAALRKQKHYQSALNCYRRALALVPGDPAAMGNMANVLKDLQRLPEALELHSIVVAHDPNNIQSQMNYACALREAGNFKQALIQLDYAQSVAPDHAGIEWERAQNLLYLGRYHEGWQAYEARWHTGDLPVRQFPYPQWQGESLKGKHILLHTEQGYGDTILATRFIPLLKQQGANVTMECKPELHRLLKQCGVDELITSAEHHNNPVTAPANQSYDFHCPLMSLMAALDILVDDIPESTRLYIPEGAKQKFSFLAKRDPKLLKVGIVWSGSLTFANNTNRAVSLERFLPLAEIPQVRLFSLQKGPREKDLASSHADCVIENLGSRCDDFADTAAAIAQLDVIVMTDTSVAHLAASMGKTVINLLQAVPYWLYTLESKTTPWYPSMQLIKQQQAGQWDVVFEQAEALLANMALALGSKID